MRKNEHTVHTYNKPRRKGRKREREKVRDLNFYNLKHEMCQKMFIRTNRVSWRR